MNIASQTFGHRYATVAELQAAHPGVRPSALADDADWLTLLETLIGGRSYLTVAGERVLPAVADDAA
jgi:uncharacterized membrane protein YccC